MDIVRYDVQISKFGTWYFASYPKSSQALSNYQHTHGKDPNSSTLQEALQRKQKKKGVKAGSGSWLGVVAGYADLHVEAIDGHGSEMIILLVF